MTSHFEKSLLYTDVDLETAHAVVSQAPLPEVFAQRKGPFPRITEVTDQVGAWAGEVGETRRIHMSDGGTLLETIVDLDAPNSFTYTLSEITGPMKLLVAGLRGQWSFAERADGTLVTWTWDVEPRSPIAAPVLPVLRLFWQGYAAAALTKMDQMVKN